MISPGIGIGKAFVYIEENLPIPNYEISSGQVEYELERFEIALRKAADEVTRLKEQLSAQVLETEGRFLEAHLLMLADPELAAAVARKMKESRRNVEWVLLKVVDELARRLDSVPDDYLRERSVDLHDVSNRILDHLLYRERISLADLPPDSVVVAHNLLPSDAVTLNRRMVAGIAMDVGGTDLAHGHPGPRLRDPHRARAFRHLPPRARRRRGDRRRQPGGGHRPAGRGRARPLPEQPGRLAHPRAEAARPEPAAGGDPRRQADQPGGEHRGAGGGRTRSSPTGPTASACTAPSSSSSSPTASPRRRSSTAPTGGCWRRCPTAASPSAPSTWAGTRSSRVSRGSTRTTRSWAGGRCASASPGRTSSRPSCGRCCARRCTGT